MNITGKTKLLGLIGWPVAHTFSPAMHNAAAAALELDLVYVPLPVPPAAVGQAVRGLVALGFLGANVTVPHKRAVIPYLDEIAPAARAIGAVNTITISRLESQTAPESPISPSDRGRPSGFNTDWSGFLADLESLSVEVEGRECLLLGAGGAARAVAYALARAGGSVTVLARRPEQARQLLADLQTHVPQGSLHRAAWDDLRRVSRALASPLIVNATPLGMHPHEDASPWPGEAPFPSEAIVYDLVYSPRRTKLMQQAQSAGCRASNGLGMLLQQGALAFEMWTGVRPPLEVMEEALQRK